MKSLFTIVGLCFFVSTSAFAEVVPQVYQDSRVSESFAQYYLNTSILNEQSVQSVYVAVQDIARYGMCDDAQCFRVYVYINGTDQTGQHIATFVASPGTGRRTPTGTFGPTKGAFYQSNGQRFLDFDIFRHYVSKKYKAPMPEAMFFTASGIALHGSYDTVNGRKQSKGCVRMFPNEARFIQDLVREAGGRLTVNVKHTR